MSNAIDKLRKHFNSKAVPNSKALKEERDTVNALIDAVDEENAKLMRIACDLHKALFALDIDHCQACPRDNINGPCTKFAVWGNDECSIEEDMRELGLEF